MSYLKSQTTVYQGKKIRVSKCQMDFGNGNCPEYELINFDTVTGVSVLPITATGILLIRHYQLGLDNEIWTLPMGGLEVNEDPIVRAGLELQEETGYKAGRLELLTRAHQLPGYIGSEAGYIYAAYDLTKAPLPGDEPFPIEVKEFSWEEVMTALASGEIIDGRTVLALLYYRQFKLE
jgi:8-oxo-dGTP pyrophosphatase MutT (NUDIX family)